MKQKDVSTRRISRNINYMLATAAPQRRVTNHTSGRGPQRQRAVDCLEGRGNETPSAVPNQRAAPMAQRGTPGMVSPVRRTRPGE
jgi:hypothetical protein